MPETKLCPNCRHTCFHLAPACETCGWDFIEEKLSRLADVRLRSPYPFFGTKKKIADDLWRLFGDCKRYIEPFLGSGAMLLARPRNRPIHCVANDKNRFICNFWRAIQFQADEVAKWCDWPVNEADLHARHSWLEAQPFEELLASTPSGEEILDRLQKLEKGLQQDPLWCDPKIAGWWAWGQSCWIGDGWCTGKNVKLKPKCTGQQGVHRKCRQVEVNGVGGVLSKQLLLSAPGGICREPAGAEHHNKRPISNRKVGVHRRHQELLNYFQCLQEGLRDVIVCCGDWKRSVTSCVLGDQGATAVFLDPPYKGFGKCYGRYHDNFISARVREWAIDNGKRERLRIILCGYEGDHLMPEDWSIYRWDHNRGMSKTEKNLGRERIWCSPTIQPLDRLEALLRVK